MSLLIALRPMRCSYALTSLLVLGTAVPKAMAVGAAVEKKAPAGCVISHIGHETSEESTRVILHANTTIDYRGGSLRGNQVVLDIANVETSLPTPVVELGAPEVDRVILGPELTRDGVKLLKVRLTGVRASSHKVQVKDNELHIDLTPLKGAREDRKGLPKVINNSSQVMARNTAQEPKPAITWAKATPLTAEPSSMEPAASGPEKSSTKKAARKMVALPVGDAVVAPVELPKAMVTVPAEKMPAGEKSTAASSKAVAQAPAPPVETSSKTQSANSAEPVLTPAKAETAPAPDDPNATPPAPEPAAAGTSSGSGMPAPASMMALAAAEQSMSGAKVLRVAVGRSLTLEPGVAIARVSVSNPAVAEPVAISPTQLLINGLTPGVVSLVLWPKQGPATVYELVVHIDTAALEQQIQTIFPGEKVRVQASKDSIVLSGTVSNPAVAEMIVKVASDYSGQVVNHLSGPGTRRSQVMLKVKFAEVSKNAMTELAAVLHHVNPVFPPGDDRGTSGTGQFTPPRGNLLNDPIGPDLTWSDAINLSFFEKTLDLGLFITALKSRGLFQELAEPTLIAADGQEASFLAGGEFPIPVAQTGANFVSVTVEWKKFGISLDFKPTIGSDGVITMKVKPEVSSLDFSNGVIIQGFRLPALIVRRAETEVELRDGQSFAIAGLYDRSLLQTKSKIPVLGDIPLLGYLFRSKGLQKNQTELLVIVTPSIVEPLGSGTPQPALEMPESFELDKHSKGK